MDSPSYDFKKDVSTLLSFVAGFADTTTFLSAAQIFSAHVTGNIVLFAADLVRGIHAADTLKLCTLAIFLLALVFSSWACRQGCNRTHRLLVVELILLLAAATYPLLKLKLSSTEEESVVMVVVFAMGVQNAFHRLEPHAKLTTTAMTSHLSQLVVDASQARALRNPIQFRILLMFTLGSMTSTVLTSRLGLAALFFPAFVLGCLLIGKPRAHLKETK